MSLGFDRMICSHCCARCHAELSLRELKQRALDPNDIISTGWSKKGGEAGHHLMNRKITSLKCVNPAFEVGRLVR